MTERATFKRTGFTHLPCSTYSCENRTSLAIGGSDALMSEWQNICHECAKSIVLSAFEIPELQEVILAEAAKLREVENDSHDTEQQGAAGGEGDAQGTDAGDEDKAPAEQGGDGFKCPGCDFEAKSASGLTSHIRSKHPVDDGALK